MGDYSNLSKVITSQNDLLGNMVDIMDRWASRSQKEPPKIDPSDDGFGGYYQTRTGDRAGFKSMGEYFQCVVRAGMPAGSGYLDERLVEIRATGLSEGVGSEGGFAVPTDFSTQLLQLAHETGLLPPLCLKIPITKGNSIDLPTIDQSSRADGSRLGGIEARWIQEAGEKPATKPKFRSLTLSAKKLVGLCWLTDELIEDQPLLETVVREGFREEFGFKLDDAIIRGTGAGQPLGVLNSPCLVTVSKETGQPADTIVYENILAMWSRMPGRNRKRAVWCVNQDVEPQLYSMGLILGMGGSPVYLPPTGASEQPYGSLFGRPVIPLEQCSTLGDLGDILLGDFSTYLLGQRGEMQSALSIHCRFQWDEQCLRFVLRIDGQPLWHNALTPFKGANELSPFITLEART